MYENNSNVLLDSLKFIHNSKFLVYYISLYTDFHLLSIQNKFASKIEDQLIDNLIDKLITIGFSRDFSLRECRISRKSCVARGCRLRGNRQIWLSLLINRCNSNTNIMFLFFYFYGMTANDDTAPVLVEATFQYRWYPVDPSRRKVFS